VLDLGHTMERRAAAATEPFSDAARGRLRARMSPSEPFDARLVAARPLSPSVREMVFERADERPFDFAPGQWVNLVLPLPGGEVKRAYSIASPPAKGARRFEIAVTRVQNGPGSTFLHELSEGEALRAIGPQGLFTRGPDEEAPSLFIGTGTGVTPLRSMIRAAIDAGSTTPLWLLFGARYEADILYWEELAELARARPNVRYDITLSRPGPSWPGRSGYVQAHLPELVRALREAAPGAEPRAYVCGLDRMVSSVRGHLRNELGFERRRVHTERYD
jgi:CDP-4-dehydro-6-deoxyglucose reductase, E3